MDWSGGTVDSHGVIAVSTRNKRRRLRSRLQCYPPNEHVYWLEVHLISGRVYLAVV
jgi:hypothetical protein